MKFSYIRQSSPSVIQHQALSLPQFSSRLNSVHVYTDVCMCVACTYLQSLLIPVNCLDKPLQFSQQDFRRGLPLPLSQGIENNWPRSPSWLHATARTRTYGPLFLVQHLNRHTKVTYSSKTHQQHLPDDNGCSLSLSLSPRLWLVPDPNLLCADLRKNTSSSLTLPGLVMQSRSALLSIIKSWMSTILLKIYLLQQLDIYLF